MTRQAVEWASLCNGKAEKVTLRILQEWLERKGVLVTWPTLVQTLRDRTLDSGRPDRDLSFSSATPTTVMMRKVGEWRHTHTSLAVKITSSSYRCIVL